MDFDPKELNQIFDDLKRLLKTPHVDVLGSFRWVNQTSEKKFRGGKKTYECRVIQRFDSGNPNICHQWYLNLQPPKIELIVDFRIANIGDVTLYQLEQTHFGIREVCSKILKTR